MTVLKLTFLGTGGSWPSKDRNVSAMGLKYGGDVLLFDCGEGTQRQLMHSNLSFMQIKNIFISHFHGDHFLGLPGLIQSMSLNDRNEELTIYGPSGIHKLLDSILNLGHFTPSYPIKGVEVNGGDIIEFQRYSIQVIEAQHSVPTVAYLFNEAPRPGKFNKPKALELGIPEGAMFAKLQRGETIEVDGKTIEPSEILGPPRPGRRVLYSGDTKPCDAIKELSQGVEALVHEGTLSGEMGDKAEEFGHSSVAQVAQLAKDADVTTLYLIHISPRYKEIEPVLEEAKAIFPNTIIPSDLDEHDVPFSREND